jgi:carbonic anhydrase
MADFNISQDNVSGECNLKCAYSFQYSNSNCVANNTGSAITLSYDESNVPPVTYNGNKYKVSDVTIYASSYFLFNGKPVKGIIMIRHAPIVGGNTFLVIIPIISGNSSMPSSNILTQIINQTANLAPKSGNKSVISVENYNLNNIVPKKPFYSFNIPDPHGDTEVIAYGIEYAITIDADTIAKLNSIIKSETFVFKAAGLGKIFFNPKGPNSSGSSSGNDDIYIDCQPVNVSEETIQMSTENKLSADYKMKSDYNTRATLLKIFYNPWFQLLLLIFAIVLFYYFIEFVLKLGDAKVVK